MDDLLKDALECLPAPQLVINGVCVWGDGRFDVLNPATGLAFASAPDCARETMDYCVDCAHAAFPGWSGLEMDARRSALRGMADALNQAKENLATLLTLEQGKPLQAAQREIEDTARVLRHSANVELPDETIQNDDRARVVVTHRPLGVVAAITPWNYPVFLMGMKLGPALLAGNTVVVKPSPFTPLATLASCELMQKALPPGVLNVISGGNELGAWLTEHPLVRKVSFTGSVATGQRVAAACAKGLKRVTLELGGNDPAIVLEDADPEAIHKGIFWGAFTNCGQICAGVKRLYVPRALHEPVLQALLTQAERIRIGDGLTPRMHLGPINNAPQLDRVKHLVADAVSNGAVATTPSSPVPETGFFHPLTFLTNVTEDMPVVREEQFGPVLPILPYDDLDDVIERANASEFGLSASVWGRDREEAAQIARRLDCGTTYVNTHLALEPHIPFGGRKSSGLGVENGKWGLAAFTDVVVDYVAA